MFSGTHRLCNRVVVWQSRHFTCSTGLSIVLSCGLQNGVIRHQKLHFRHHYFGGRCAQVSCYNTNLHCIYSEMVREIQTDPIYSFLLLLLFSSDFCPKLISLLSGLALSCVFQERTVAAAIQSKHFRGYALKVAFQRRIPCAASHKLQGKCGHWTMLTLTLNCNVSLKESSCKFPE